MALHYKGEHTTSTGSQKTLRKMLTLIPALAVAVLCYSVTVYAWFSTSLVNTGNIITAATYGLDIVVKDENESTVQPSNGLYNLTGSQSYTVTLTKTGGASTGYCVVKEGENIYYTAPITTESPTLTFTITKCGNYTFTAVWGKYSGKADITNGYTIGTEQPETGEETPAPPANGQNAAAYVVQSGDTLGKIAQEYGTAVEKLAAYNGIENPNEIQTGQTLEIPPEDYEIPSPPAVSGGKDEPAQQPAEAEEPAEETPPEQANPVTETMPADTPAVSQPAETSAATGSGNAEPAVPPASPESTEPTGSEPPEPDLSETDETNESQSS